MKLVWFLLFMSLPCWALVPVEGIILGEANQSYQTDPLAFIFRDHSHGTPDDEFKKVKFYQHGFQRGLELKESCGYLRDLTYSQKWMETQAKRSLASGLQYVGLDLSIKAIGAYAKAVDLEPEAYQQLSKNIVRNYCSKNMTLFSLKTLEKSLEYAYNNPDQDVLPTLSTSPYVAPEVKSKIESQETRKKEFDYAIKNFRAFCSWGGSVEDYRLMTPYLKNPFIMSFVIENMSGLVSEFNEKSKSVIPVKNEKSIQVACRELVCRDVTSQEFAKLYPLSAGSTGVNTDLKKLYCQEFRDLDFRVTRTLPEVRKWVKQSDEEQFIFETNFFISMMSGVSDVLFSVSTYQELFPLMKARTDERWTNWATELLGSFSHNLLYEESLKVKATSRGELSFREKQKFTLDFLVTMGEMDRMLENDKLKLSFNLKISKNFLRYLRSRWDQLARNSDIEGQPALKQEFARLINVQLKEKQKLFSQPMWNDDFSILIVDELLAQVIDYQGNFFNSYQEEMLDVPVKFSFGTLAMGYLRYRADVRAQRLKLNL